MKNPITPTVFEALTCSIVEQQISLNVAHNIQRNLIKTFGDTLRINNEVYYVFPTPQRLASAAVGQLRKCGLSQNKAEYVRDISGMVVDGRLDLDKFKNYENPDEIISELSRIREIGVWTAKLAMLRGMHKLEVIPTEDTGLRRIISHYYCNNRKISSSEICRIAEKWGKWKGLASFYLIIAWRVLHYRNTW